jgi:NAD(P)-dependent dehydrogenase (short-subunit alcohol dehydrogenase family)
MEIPMVEQPVVLVTGAAGNLGRAVAERLAAEGQRLALLDQAAPALQALAASLPGAGAHLPLPGVDLTEAGACAEAVARILDRFGRLDGVAHTVGGFAAAPIAGAGPALWEAMFRLNLLTTANLFGAAIARMRPAGRGALVAVGAMAALKAPSGLAAYAAAKSGVLRLVESYAEEVKAEGLRVNAVLPGTLDTPQNRAAMPGVGTAGWVRPAQLAEVVAFLLSDSASGITGALVPVTARG